MSTESTLIKPLVVRLNCNYIPSVNNMYTIRRGRLVLTDQACAYKNQLISQLSTLDDYIDYEKDYPWIYDDIWLDIEIHFILKQSLVKRDVDNLLKLTIDAFKVWSRIDDANYLQVIGKKFLDPNLEQEQIIIIYQPSQLNYKKYEGKFT